MVVEAHLVLQEAHLSPGEEWTLPGDAWRFVSILSGQGYWLGEQRVSLEVGDALMLSPSGMGKLRASQLNPLQLIHFQFHPERLTDVLTPVERHYLESSETQGRLAFKHYAANDPFSRQFTALVESPGSQNSLAKRSGLLQIIAAGVGGETSTSAPRREMLPGAKDRVLGRLSQMTENEFINCGVEELARECRCSTRHLSRLFLRTFGISLSARQTELRMQRASRLLRETDLKISQVALECGYRHIGLFNSTFKNRWKQTPTQWRQGGHAAPQPLEKETAATQVVA